MKRVFARIAVPISMAAALFSGGALAQVANGGFESGNLSGWTVTSGAVEVIQSSDFSNPIAPPDGSYYALLSNTPDQTTGVDSGQDRDGVDGNEQDVAILTQTFTISSAPQTLRFSVAMLTDEGTGAGGPPGPNSTGNGHGSGGNSTQGTPTGEADIFECTVDGTPVVQGGSSSDPTYTSVGFPFAGPFDGNSYAVTSPGSVNGSSFDSGVTAFQTVSATLSTTGSHTLECYLGDGFGDGEVDSGLLLDGVSVQAAGGGGAGGATPVPSSNPAWLALLALLLAGGTLLAYRRIRS